MADYLYRESLMQLPAGDQRFLRCTAVLDQLCAPLCEALLGEPDAQERLRNLEASGLFLVPLDRRREWYRYHSLFREFLLGELRRVEPDVITKLHLRAADWYESNGSPAMAVEHLLQTSERERCIKLVTELVLPSFEAGQLTTVQRWLSTLGDSAIREYPPLAVLAAWITMYTGQIAETQRWAAIVDTGSYDLVPLDGSASFDSARAMLRAMLCRAGPEQMLADASVAVSQEPPWSPWRDTALTLYAEAHLLSGDIDQANALFTEASAVAAALGNTDPRVVSEAELALLAMDRGRWEEAAEHTTVALAGIEDRQMHDYPTAVLAFAAAARLAMHRGDLNEANRQLTLAMRARPSLTFVMPIYAVRARLHLAKVYWAIAEQRAARHLLHEIDDVLLHRPALGALVDEVSELRRLLTSRSAVGATGGPPLSPSRTSAAPVSSDAPHDPRDRRAFVRVPQHCQLPSRLDLPKARRLLTQRSGTTSDGGWSPRRIAEAHPPDLRFQGIIGVVPKCHRQLRRRRDNARKPDDGNNARQHIDNLGGRRPRIHRSVGLGSIRRYRATHGNQRRKADECQRLWIEFSSAVPGLPNGIIHNARIVDSQTAQQFPVVQSHSPPFALVASDGTLTSGRDVR